jgi:Haem-binding domain
MVAVVAVAVMVGRVRTERRNDVEQKNWGLPSLWDSAPAQILVRACGNCHSSHTDWPWYSHIAPFSWWTARHVREGREKLDLSEWETYSVRHRRDILQSICGLIKTGRMPPPLYAAIHPEAKLTANDKQAVCAWITQQIIAVR